MGANQSSPGTPPSHELLERLSGNQTIEHQDVFWKQLLFLAFPTPLASLPPEEVQAKLGPHCQQLLVFNPITHNFQSLVLHCIVLLHDARGGKNQRPAANALRLISSVIKVASETGNASSMVPSLFEITPSVPIPKELVTQEHQLIKVLVRRVMATIIELELNDANHVLVYEALKLLLVSASSQVFSPVVVSPPGTHPMLEAMLVQYQFAPQVIQRLLQLLVQRPLPPRDGSLYAGQSRGGVTHLAKSAASTLLWFPTATYNGLAAVAGTVVGSGSSDGGAFNRPQSPVAEAALMLTLVLCYSHNPRNEAAESAAAQTGKPGMVSASPSASVNPFQFALNTLLDLGEASAGDLEGGGAGALSPAPAPPATTDHRTPSGTSDPVAAFNAQPLTRSPPTQARVNFGGLFIELASLLAASMQTDASSSAATSADGTNGAAKTGQEASGQASNDQGKGSAGVGAHVEAAALLAYALLHGCTSFREYVLSRPDIELLVVPLLRHMYGAASNKQHTSFMYMLQILLLLLSQDPSFASNIHLVNLPGGAPWYKEQRLTVSGSSAAAGGGVGYGSLSLGSLVVIVLLRTIASGLSGGRQASDLAVPTNALAALANLAPYMAHLHVHAAQRLVSLLQALAKRHARLQSRLSQSSPEAQPPLPLAAAATVAAQQGASKPDAPDAPPADAAEVAQLETELEVVSDCLRVLLEVMNAALIAPVASVGQSVPHQQLHRTGSGNIALAAQQQLLRNFELLYALLHGQTVLALLRAQPPFMDLVNNLQAIVDFFNRRFDDARAAETKNSPHGFPDSWSSVSRVQELVITSAHYWRADRLKPFPELRFVYEEEQGAESFFVPYIWKLVLQTTRSLRWDTRNAELIDV